MIELSFHEELYDGFAVDEAAKLYGDYAATELVREADRYIVKVTASPETLARGISEEILCAELLNVALGKTIENRGGPEGNMSGGKTNGVAS